MGKYAAHQPAAEPDEASVPPAGSRYFAPDEGPWLMGVERRLSTGPLARAVADLAAAEAPAEPACSLAQLAAIGRIRSMLDGLEATLLADAHEMVQRGLSTPLAQQNPTLFAGDGRTQEHGYPLSRLDRGLNRSSLVAEAALSLRTSERGAFSALAVAEGLRYVHDDALLALYRGDMTGRTAATLVKQTGGLPRETARRIGQSALGLAGTLSDASMARHIKRQRERLHPEPITDRRSRAELGRSLTWWPEEDGMAILQAYLPAEEVLAIFNTVGVHANSLRDPEERRHLGQLRADVFRDAVLEGWPGAPVGGRGLFVGLSIPALELLCNPERGIAQLQGYGPIPIGAALRLAARAPSLKRILTDPWTGAMLDLGRKSYRPNRALRDYLRLRDEHCRMPGCRRIPELTEFDHIEPWGTGGRTSAGNAQLLCRRHQVYKHVLGWEVVHRGNGVLQWRSPHGVVVLDVPEQADALGPFRQPMLPPGTQVDAASRKALGWDPAEVHPEAPQDRAEAEPGREPGAPAACPDADRDPGRGTPG
ncbi:HNH endonuclease signature motif containing protein [Paeniglutamicibacter cryotolerans]|uniref:HNH nuclease domain-containing protein n=1 Tax=Paeniglutamicibacter cryotolerans TaxID=670079 RepID=A0A839QFX3_9MICC|nr:HNH endonuclease signature motif containing protein [Paeniglutamicibacter cryotolerans]MBB2995198.1 hypothetical protein [Paeniglutamicibacter cryotolerans]